MTGAAARPERPFREEPPAPRTAAFLEVHTASPGHPAPSRLPPRVTRIHVIRDDNDGARARADFGDVRTALIAVKAHMTRPGVYSIMITFDE